MTNLVDDVAYQALDAIGVEISMGNIEDGSDQARVLLRAYGQCLRQLLRACHWNFARKTAPLTLLADATGQTPNVGSLVPLPWVYEYEYPNDCMKARFVPWNYAINPAPPAGNIVPPNNTLPITTGNQPGLTGQRLRPARFTEATDFNYPPPAGSQTWEAQGVSPQGRTVILTNVQQAQLVYTALMLYPANWDALFRAAMVAYLASEVALACWVQKKDPKFGLQMRNEQIKVAKEKIMQARMTDGNEGWFQSDLAVDWMANRNTGTGFGWGFGAFGAGGLGCLGYGYDQLSFADGSAY